MSNNISIGIAKHTDAFRDALGQNIQLMETKGVKMLLRENTNGRFVIFSCTGVPKGRLEPVKGQKPLFMCTIASAIADLIISRWEKVMLFNIIKNDYASLGKNELQSIYELALERMEKLDEDAGQLQLSQRKMRIQIALEEFLFSSDHINVDGFVVFRLKGYLSDLRWVVGQAVDDFLMEREYQDFINLLRFFLQNQEHRLALVHVLVKPPGHFQLYDTDFRPVEYKYLEGFIVDVNHRQIDYEDVLISALITLAPGRVILHSPGVGKLTEHTVVTLQAVFDNKVEECAGCRLCAETDVDNRHPLGYYNE